MIPNSVNTEELRALLLTLLERFQPAEAFAYETDCQKQAEMVKFLPRPYEMIYALCEAVHADLSHPDFTKLEEDLHQLPFEACCQYLLFYLRIPARQGGGMLFVRLWKEGVIAALIRRMLSALDGGSTADYCPKCKTALRGDYRFCPGCGQDLTKPLCLYCGREIPADARFCPYCGGKLEGAHQIKFQDDI